MVKKYKYILFVILMSSITSCYTKKNILYFKDLEDKQTWSSAIANKNNTPKFEVNDRISVRVLTIDKGTTDLLNSGVLINSSTSMAGGAAGGGNISSTTNTQNGYYVDQDGNIFLPYIGKLKALGLTKDELRQEITTQISRYIKDPIVYVDWLNFKYTIIGRSGTNVYHLENENLNVIEAIAKAGDFGSYADMQNVMLIREEGNERKMVRLDFQNSELLNSPYFYLKQNDILYVVPTKYADETTNKRLSQITTVASLATLPISLTNTILLIRARLK
jgi:polysaccharide export outer membrane protein